MELQIQDLVTSIKKEGIEKAQEEASRIINEANEKAKKIISEAEEKAKKIFEDSEKEIGILRESARLSAQQALRDASITFEKEVQKKFKSILSEKLKSQVLAGTELAKLVIAALNGEDPSNYNLQIQQVSDELKEQLAEQINNGLEIHVNNTGRGFKLAAKDGSGFFDLTEDEITDMISNFIGEIKI